MQGIKTVRDIAVCLDSTESEVSAVLTNMRRFCRRLLIPNAKKPDKPPRVVYDPTNPLRALQQRLYKGILLKGVKRSDSSHGGIAGRSILTAVAKHLNNAFVYTADITDFYPRIHFTRVQRLFAALGCPNGASKLLARLCTFDYQLAQGFITSPIIADAVIRSADQRIQEMCRAQNLTYTRFVDDITISCNFDIEESGIPGTINAILNEHGFFKNASKERFGKLSEGATILGLRINRGHADVTRVYNEETLRRLRDVQSLVSGGSFEGPYYTYQQLLGRCLFISAVNPGRKPALFSLFRSIDWKKAGEIAIVKGCVKSGS